jgi:hypothetical protein
MRSRMVRFLGAFFYRREAFRPQVRFIGGGGGENSSTEPRMLCVSVSRLILSILILI